MEGSAAVNPELSIDLITDYIARNGGNPKRHIRLEKVNRATWRVAIDIPERDEVAACARSPLAAYRRLADQLGLGKAAA